jgi:hypothetical protein
VNRAPFIYAIVGNLLILLLAYFVPLRSLFALLGIQPGMPGLKTTFGLIIIDFVMAMGMAGIGQIWPARAAERHIWVKAWLLSAAVMLFVAVPACFVDFFTGV